MEFPSMASIQVFEDSFIHVCVRAVHFYGGIDKVHKVFDHIQD